MHMCDFPIYYVITLEPLPKGRPNIQAEEVLKHGFI